MKDAVLLEIAEDAFATLPPGPGVVTHREPRFGLVHTPAPVPIGGTAQRLRVDDDFARAVRDARAWFAGRGRHEFVWTVGPSTRPADAERRLLAAGARPWDEDPVWTGMVLTEEPPAVPGVDVRRVETLEEAYVAADILALTNGWSDEVRAAEHDTIPERWARRDPTLGGTFLAYVDGEAVAFGAVWYGDAAVYLSGGGTVEHARGRGAYRALVRARWHDAVARGRPALVVQAGEMSKPILERLGFRTLCEIHALVDTAAR